MQVRLAREDEYVAAGVLTVAAYDAHDYLTKPDGTYDQRYADWLVDAASRGRDGDLLVAVDGNDLLGTATWCPPGSRYRELATQDHQGEFRTLAVSPEARGRGVGTAIITDCLRRAESLGLTEVLLCSLQEMTPAHRLYESFGFGRRPELDWSPVEGVDLWAVSMPLAGR